ncbi:DHA2 family efflux MFS transporter permease subunit [Archangium lansingense]|uniref:DHA2 family efflux MFS transporter permease subunit n=1 Tax=Archangium lansingense TaxID=2995310 RepID=A0ABT4ACS9_9BACT|nr:DHA2 family efflux MFS transporter permease subunit [Archangium lansinium]MCY1079485.1 DHA2 family efflux MFS transporter permease subunit [Archangium lansinium]
MPTEAALPTPRPAARKAPVNKWLVTLSVSFGTLMGSIDSSIVNVALSQIRSSIGATVQEITWMSTSFIIATVLMLPLTGFFGRLFGQKRTYLACLALFIVSSFFCGVAWSLPSLVFFRALQGLGAGLLVPTEQAILRQTWPPEEQGMAMGLFTTVITVGPALGPTLGGYIVDNFHWSWIFFINLPIGLLGLFLVWRFVEEPEDVLAANRAAAELQRRNIDWAGISLLWVGMATLQFVLEEGQRHDWFESRGITTCLLAAVFCLAAFVLRELTAVAPAVDLRLFKEPVFSSGAVLGAVMFFILTSNLFLLPLFMQELLGFTAMQAGEALMPRTLVMIVMMPIVGRLYNRISPRVLIGVGLLIIGVGVHRMMRVSLDTGRAEIISAIMLQGLGTSLLFVPLNVVVFDKVERARMADATGINTLMRQLGTSVGLALFATLMTRYTAQAQVGLSAQLVAERPELYERISSTMSSLVAGGVEGYEATEASLRLLASGLQRQASLLAFNRLFTLSALLFALALPLLGFLWFSPGTKPARRAPKAEPDEVHLDVEV